VGRSSEFRLLRDAWEAARLGRGQTLLLRGEAGIGKSRHILELRRAIAEEPHELLFGACSPYHQSTALYPIINALSEWLELGQGSPDDGELRLRKSLQNPSEPVVLPLLAALLSIPGKGLDPLPPFGPQKMRERTLEAVVEWILARGREKPVVCVIEDLHWADPTTLELAGLLASHREASALILLSSRPVDGQNWPEDSTHALPLGPLASEDIATILAHARARYALSEHVAQDILERSEGIPLFAEELCKSVAAIGHLVPVGADSEPTSPRPSFPVPATLQESVNARLDQLGRQKTVAQVASVLGREFRVDILEAVHRAATNDSSVEVQSAVRAMLHLALVSQLGDNIYAFHHALIQEATYGTLTRAKRVHYHQHAARVLLSTFPGSQASAPEVLARHFADGELEGEAAQQFAAAGARSLMRAAYVEGATQFQRALECTQRLPESPARDVLEVNLRAGLGFSLLVSKGFGASEVETVYRRGLQLAERMRGVPLRILYGIWAFHMLRGDTAETARLVPSYQRICETSDNPLELLVANAALGSRAFYRGRYDEAVPALTRATELCDRENPGAQSAMLLHEYNFEGLLYAPMFLAYSHLYSGRITSYREVLRSSLDLAEKSNHPYLICSGLGCAGPMLRDIGDVETTAEIGSRLMRLAVDHGFPHWIASALCLSGWSAARIDPNGPGVDMLKQGIQAIKTIGSLLIYPYYVCYLAEVELLAGRPKNALPLLEEALVLGEDGLNNVYLPEIRRLRGVARAALGDIAGAESDFRVTLATTHAQGACLLALRAAQALADLLEPQGRTAEAALALRAAYAALPERADLADVQRAEQWLAKHER
jgi:predicted ATPase